MVARKALHKTTKYYLSPNAYVPLKPESMSYYVVNDVSLAVTHVYGGFHAAFLKLILGPLA